jgi:hypothetical protein
MRISQGVLFALMLTAAVPASAQNDCSGARDDYSRAIEAVADALRLYSRCISESGGRNSCALEFKRLEKAQRSFDEAVMQIGFRCRAERQGKFGEPD